MIQLPKRETKALVNLHGWSAIFLGFLLYAVVATGTVAVLAHEIEHWSIGDVRHGNPLRGDVDSIVRDLSTRVDPRFLEDVGIGPSSAGNLSLFFHTHRKNDHGEQEEYGVEFEAHPETGEILGRRLGTAAELHHTEAATALSRFFVDIHTELHLPRPWGLLLTGILGLAMMAAAVSGLLMHRHLLADLFTLRRERSDVVAKRDVHTVAGSWGLPFAFILAFTGSFFSFTGSFGLPAMAMVAFGGDQEAIMRTILGTQESDSDVEQATTNLNTLIADGHRRSGVHPEFVSVSHFNRGDARVLLFAGSAGEDLEPVQLEYDGTDGSFLRRKPSIGQVPSAGSVVYSLMGPLHFGHFAGVLSKAVWVALGFASCYVILSGFSLWLARRRENRRWALFERYTVVFGTGLPLCMLVAGAGYFTAPWLGLSTNIAVPWSFSIAALLCLCLPWVIRDSRVLQQRLLALCTLLCIALPLVRLAAGGPGWLSAIARENLAVPMIDLLLVVGGVFCLLQLRPGARRETDTVEADPATAPHPSQ